MPVFLSDIRHCCRALLAQPAWTLAAFLCVAIGTGANTASFSVINGVLLRPLPFEEPHQLVMVALREPVRSQAGPFSLADFRDIEPMANMFQQLAARTFLPVSLAAEAPARMVQAEFVTAGYFEMLRIRPRAGRFFGAAPDRPGAELEAVLSDRVWRTRFNSDLSVVGKLVRVNGRTVRIRGVAPAGFVGVMQIIAADIWLPASAYGSFSSPESPHDAEQIPMFGVIARLKPSMTPMRARQQVNALVANLWRVRVRNGTPPSAVVEEATGFGVPPAVRRTVIGGSALLFGLMALLVAIAIANVAGLMLARSAGRGREMAVRIALGAGPSRLVRLVLTESLILALAGCCLGSLFAVWLPHLVTGFGPQLPEHLSFAIDVQPDWRVAIYAPVSAIGIAALFGFAPARHAARTELVLALKGSGGSSRMPSTLWTLNAFVIGQVAVSTVLLVIAGLFVRTYLNTHAVDPGIDIRNSLAVSLDLNQSRYDAVAGRALLDRLLARVSSVPGIQTAALTRQAPLSPGGTSVELWLPTGTHTASAMLVSPGYFNTLRIPLVHGRNFGPADNGTLAVAIINETMAERYWPRISPLGQTFRIGDLSGRQIEVIGVAKDIKYRNLSETPPAVFYEPLTQTYSTQMTLVARAYGDPRLLIEPIRREIQSQNPDLAVVDVRTLEDRFRESAAPALQRSIILVSTCAIGLLLSSLGLFGVVSYSVRQRVRELGVRMALGARPRHIATMVLRQALQLVMAGLAIGLIASFAATRIIASVLFGVSPQDPATLGLVAFLLISIALAASYLPARWATRVDPILAIRAE